MEVFEITGYRTGVANDGVNYLSPADSFQNIYNGYIYRQVLQSRQGVGFFTPRLNPVSPAAPPIAISGRRVYGIFEHILPDSTKELLAIDTNFLYKFNDSTGVFDQVPFGGSLTPGGGNDYTGFNISSNDFYISGVSYPYADNTGRFVFTGEGINNQFPDTTPISSTIFMYDGTNVLSYTDNGDNPDFTNPPQGSLQSATYVLWFNERINFIVPVIASVAYNQGILYSGIRTGSGNGDKFNVAGSGLLQADTYELITGATILGQVLALNFNRSNWTAERTRDAFNPYFIRKVPSVIGTNAKFSAVSWFDSVRSIGKTGIVGTDGRQSLRTDDKIPYFTNNEMDAKGFNLTYGGFDRVNNQFLWSYLQSGTTSTTQNSVLVGNYEEDTWSIYDQRFSVLGQTDKGLNFNWDDISETTGNESWSSWDTTEDIWDRIGQGQEVQKTLAGDDLGFIYDINQDYDDYYTTISAISQGYPTTVTVTATGILAGDKVTISNVEGMVEINNYEVSTNTQLKDSYNVISSTPTSIVIDVDSTLFGAYTQNGNLSKIISFYAETIPFNPYRSIGRKCFISYVEFLIDNNGGSLKVDVYANEEKEPFKKNILLLPSKDSTADREWISMCVNNESNFMSFVMKQESPSVQLRLTSMRIHCQAGSLTSG